MEKLEKWKGGEMKNGRLEKIILWQEKRLWLFKKIKMGFGKIWKNIKNIKNWENGKYEKTENMKNGKLKLN